MQNDDFALIVGQLSQGTLKSLQLFIANGRCLRPIFPGGHSIGVFQSALFSFPGPDFVAGPIRHTGRQLPLEAAGQFDPAAGLGKGDEKIVNNVLCGVHII